MDGQPLRILMVEDNELDVILTQRAFRGAKVANEIRVARDAVEALAYLRRQGDFAGAPRPDLILLDLNLPGKDGRELLAEIKADPDLMRIPVVVLTSSKAEQDIVRAYDLHANCYVVKPVGIEALMQVAKSMDDFWFALVKLPPKP